MLSIILVAISLSMDAFSLSLCLGTLNIRYKKILLFSIIVGIFHFIMPLIGMIIGDITLKFIRIDTKYITFMIFFILGLFMFFDKEENKKSFIITILSLIVIGSLVSIDAFVAGLGINLINDNHMLCCSMFSIFSFLFTLSGLLIGKHIKNRIGSISKRIGAILLIALSIQYLTK